MSPSFFGLLRLIGIGFLLCGIPNAQAIILYGLGNGANLTDPGTGVPFDSIGQIVDSSGANISGTAIYLGNGFMLTANHVSVNNSFSNFVTFDGVTKYSVDSTYNSGQIVQQVRTGLDLKIFRLTANPTVSTVQLLTTPTELASTTTIVGSGVGRDAGSAVGTNTVNWGTTATAVKRWGLNVPYGIQNNVAYSANSINYSENLLLTVAGSSGSLALGNNEAGIASLDSGCGMFQKLGSTWYLIGVGVVQNSPGSYTTFGVDNSSGSGSTGDINGFVRVSDYAADILSITSVPEPTTDFYLISGLLAGVFCFRRREHPTS